MDSSNCEARAVNNIKIVNFDVNIQEIKHDLFKKYGIPSGKLPYSTGNIKLEISGVSIAVVNGLRRVLLDEMTGYSLRTDFNKLYVNNDPFIIQENVNDRIALIPIKLQVDQSIIDDVEFYIDITNDTSENRTIYSGDIQFRGNLKTLLFNPTTPIVVLMPTHRFYVDNIKIHEGTGSAFYKNIHNAIIKNLDIEPDDDIDGSGYKVSTLLADSSHFLLTFNVSILKERNEIVLYMKDAMKNIIGKVRNILTELEKNTIMLDDGSENYIFSFKDTKTISELILKTSFDLTKNSIKKIKYLYDDESKLSTFDVIHTAPYDLIKDVLNHIIDIYEAINDKLK